MLARTARPALIWRSCRHVSRTRQSVRYELAVHAISGNGTANTISDLREPGNDATVDSDFTQPPEWVKILAIALASSLVALIELAVCRSALLLPFTLLSLDCFQRQSKGVQPRQLAYWALTQYLNSAA